MNFRRKYREGAEVSTESLNDIMFFLLLFFLIISTLANQNLMKLTLPSSSKQQQQMLKLPIIVEVTKDLQYFVNSNPVPFPSLEKVLSEEMKRVNKSTVILRFDQSLTIQDLVDVLQLGYKLNAKMSLATKPRK